ncbi:MULTISPECIES: EAL domain-containing protein [unclassified Arthrobacter]|uniref:putative bifunctional diguanylate cyclase/phosphodiesterase n=1 Tax=unclassified Arthrobacter TaxID=235627 RepID=UPI001E30A884|nr:MULTISPECIES: EAL domain-containing protein [unclassified Arthrobacter]MCC9146164.1 EAL domain-containing protein [Arthrobacter sp. zg-Y919]MDK1277394.1 EAL domain-containing protein [Arthrobacter sp. zg.Y919]WIB03891.1 EAL domain-containing protein [Arthrobacter sp. zg-Y919]
MAEAVQRVTLEHGQDVTSDPRLDRIVEGIVSIAAGNLTARIPISPTRDQIDAVSTGINLLAAELDDVYQDMEHRVESRTLELREAHRQMERMALSDPLTGLGNRIALMQQVELALEDMAGGAAAPGVLMIDLDGFKEINDSFGHRAGDLVLQEVASRMLASVPEGSLVARLGGDEFAVLLPAVGRPSAHGVAEAIQASLGVRILVEELDVWPRASIGAHVAQAGQSAEDLLLYADTAMYVAKEEGPGLIRSFEPVMLYARQLRREMVSELRNAVDRDEFRLAYQPVVDLVTGRMQGVEVLLRWEHPTQGLTMPDAFIPMAEESGAILRIGRWVLRSALEQLAAWRAEGRSQEGFHVRVNVSPSELQNMDLVDYVRAALRDTGAAPQDLVLEITESAFVGGGDVETYSMRSLKALGVRLEIDDFGTGYSSISYLRRLPVDTVKVDRALIADISRDEGQLQFVDAVHRLIQAAGMEAVFEGIETRNQAGLLRRMGCSSGQGYFFSRPLTADQVGTLLASGSRLPLATELLA